MLALVEPKYYQRCICSTSHNNSSLKPWHLLWEKAITWCKWVWFTGLKRWMLVVTWGSKWALYITKLPMTETAKTVFILFHKLTRIFCKNSSWAKDCSHVVLTLLNRLTSDLYSPPPPPLPHTYTPLLTK